MRTFDRYLLREFTQSVFAALVVLGMVSMSALIGVILDRIARGKVPASLLLSQLGLQLLSYLPLILPLALMLGLLLALGRLYRDSEMPVLAAVGVGPRRMLRPLSMLLLPVLLVVGACSLWLGPWGQRVSNSMIDQANRSLVVAGMEPGRFTSLPGGGVVYIGGVSDGGQRLQRIFVHRRDGDRVDVTTAAGGRLYFDGAQQRYLRLEDGFRVEGPDGEGRDYRLMRYAANEIRLPDREEVAEPDDPEILPTTALLGDPRPEAQAQLHWRIAPPLLALAFGLLAVPLARGGPRQTRYGRILLGFLAYLVGMNLATLGTEWLATGKLPAALGLWWLLLPLLALGIWFYLRDGRPARRRRWRR
jgi:lipopolysaccharide export system permease protein